jgi:hypothetical protein
MPEACDPVVGCSHYLLTSQRGAQTNFHQDFTSTAVAYTVIGTRGGKGFHLVRPTAKNQLLYARYQKMPNSRYYTYKNNI